MTEKMTRSEQHAEIIGAFLASSSRTLSLHLYGREITSLEKKYPVVITKVAKDKNGMFRCSIFKRRVEQK